MSPTCLRDKDYVITSDELIFNVVGYEHPARGVYCGLKYVAGKKWMKGYRAAVEFLAERCPCYVSKDYICVPWGRIARTLCPFKRLQQLLEDDETGRAIAANDLSRLEQQAVQLSRRLSALLEIPLVKFGLTDSLLWGTGRESSDLDLVILGQESCDAILQRGASLFDEPDFFPATPEQMGPPAVSAQIEWPKLLARKHHVGLFAGRPFSLRGVRDLRMQRRDATGRVDCDGVISDGAPNSEHSSGEVLSAHRRESLFRVADASQSLYFPAIYCDAQGNQLVDYTVVHEGVFRAGQALSVNVLHEQLAHGTELLVYSGEAQDRIAIIAAK